MVQKPKSVRDSQRDLGTREKLISATVECMSEVGYFDTTTTLVAERAGLSRGALQYHFPKRQDLLVAVIDHVGQALVLSLKETSSGEGTVEDRLRNISTAYLRVFQSQTYLAQLQIWIGVRNDPHLQKKVENMVKQSAAEQDRLWKNAFSDLNIPSEVISDLRGLVISAIRGIALRAGRRLAPATFPPEIALLCDMAKNLLEAEKIKSKASRTKTL